MFPLPRRLTLLYSTVIRLGRRKSCVIYVTINFGFLSSCCHCVDRAQNLPGPAPNIWLTIFQTLYKSIHFWWSYSQTREGHFLVHIVFYWWLRKTDINFYFRVISLTVSADVSAFIHLQNAQIFHVPQSVNLAKTYILDSPEMCSDSH